MSRSDTHAQRAQAVGFNHSSHKTCRVCLSLLKQSAVRILTNDSNSVFNHMWNEPRLKLLQTVPLYSLSLGRLRLTRLAYSNVNYWERHKLWVSLLWWTKGIKKISRGKYSTFERKKMLTKGWPCLLTHVNPPVIHSVAQYQNDSADIFAYCRKPTIQIDILFQCCNVHATPNMAGRLSSMLWSYSKWWFGAAQTDTFQPVNQTSLNWTN